MLSYNLLSSNCILLNSIQLNNGLFFFRFHFFPLQRYFYPFTRSKCAPEKHCHFYVEIKYLIPFVLVRCCNRQDSWLKLERLCSRFKVQITGVWSTCMSLCSAGSMPLVTYIARGSVNSPSVGPEQRCQLPASKGRSDCQCSRWGEKECWNKAILKWWRKRWLSHSK